MGGCGLRVLLLLLLLLLLPAQALHCFCRCGQTSFCVLHLGEKKLLSLSKVRGWGWWLGGANPMDGWCGGATHWGDNGNQGLFGFHRGGGCHCAHERCCSGWSVCAVSLSVLARSWKSLCKALSLLPCTVVHSSGSGGPRGDPWLPLPAALLGCSGLPDSLTGQEDLKFLMAAGFWFPRPEPPGRFPLWSVRGFRPGRFPFACSCANGFGALRPPHWLLHTE